MTQVFISYSRKDEVFARRVAQSLTEQGINVWMDIEDIHIGSKWSSAIQQGLDSSDLLCVILSPASMESSNVEDEFTYFLDQKKPVIPVYWKPCKVHFQLGRVQYIDFYSNPYEMALPLLLAEIDKRKAEAPARPAQPSPTLRVEKLTVDKPAGISANRVVEDAPAVKPPVSARAAQTTPNRTFLAVGALAAAVILGILVLLVPGLLNRDSGDITGEITDQRVQEANYQRSSDGQVAVKLPADWKIRQEGESDLWITNNDWFYANSILNPSVDAGNISMRTFGQPVTGTFTTEDLRVVALGVFNHVFAESGQRQQFTEADLREATINGYPAVWIGGQLTDSDYYMAFYYAEDKRWLQGVVVNSGKGDLDRNQQLVNDLVRSIQIST
jgi:hypothetical protein